MGPIPVAAADRTTPLAVAAGVGWAGNFSTTAPDAFLAATRYLVEEIGLDVNAANAAGYTALMGAAWRGDNELIKYLVSKGARLDARNARGWSATDMANGPFIRGTQVPVNIRRASRLLQRARRPRSPSSARTRGSAVGAGVRRRRAEVPTPGRRRCTPAVIADDAASTADPADASQTRVCRLDRPPSRSPMSRVLLSLMLLSDASSRWAASSPSLVRRPGGMWWASPVCAFVALADRIAWPRRAEGFALLIAGASAVHLLAHKWPLKAAFVAAASMTATGAVNPGVPRWSRPAPASAGVFRCASPT